MLQRIICNSYAMFSIFIEFIFIIRGCYALPMYPLFYYFISICYVKIATMQFHRKYVQYSIQFVISLEQSAIKSKIDFDKMYT